MSLPKRVLYYLLGFSIGAIVVYFIWSGKGVSFDYGMDARTLKQIRIREKVYTPEAQAVLTKNNLDSVAVNTILKNGDVNFSESKPRIKPCPEYLISGNGRFKNIQLYIQRCDSIATIQKVIIK
ncbi:hypothetical protein KCTC32516_02124 [Polaribacter huanghezhanensis]|uniref:DUF4258 domain-containing protein n=1 Tax=Polaribacter huanghezhanensis TaxID=1354726 RepID=UPI0002663663|nr:DUF4258 domain-containing protein [Polaribacter huanghezhanensis]WKD86746.1 hypothetical protein KCTC32516_02124 [Polaribacter huanghezhanensis]